MKYWDRAWTLVEGCSPCSPGCQNCWALAMERRFRFKDHGEYGERRHDNSIRTRPDRLEIPFHRKKPTVYCIWNDLFHEDVPGTFIQAAYTTMAQARQHTFLVLTKRAKRMSDIHAGFGETGLTLRDGYGAILPNAWHGLTVCNQEEADAKIPIFLRVPGKKFLSIEPMLGLVEIDWCFPLFDHRPEYAYWQAFRPQDGKKAIKMRDGVDAVILGGETGPGARPMHPDWVRRVRDDCAAAGVPFMFKQWGEWYPDSDLAQIKDTTRPGQCRKGQPSCYAHFLGDAGSGNRETDIPMRRVGSKSAGRLLDGREHNDMPWRRS